MRYWIGPYVGDGLTPETGFRAPSGAIALPDLRPLPQQTVTSSLGFFCTPNNLALDSNYREFLRGDARQDAPREADRAVWAGMLGIPAPAGTTLLDWVWEALTVNADPDGLTGPKPLAPTFGRALELHFAGHAGGPVRSKHFDFGLDEAVPVIQLMRQDYRAVRAAAVAGKLTDPQLHRRMLDWWGDKFAIGNPEDLFIPKGLPRETRLKHATTITDNFNRADQGFIGTSSEGWSWTEIVGSAGNSRIVSNKAEITGTGSAFLERADSDLSGTDHQAQIDWTCAVASGTAGGPIARKSSTTNQTFYLCQYHRSLASFQLYKCIDSGSPSFTQLGSSQSATYSAGAPVYLSCSGTTITGKYNNGTGYNQTDSAISSGTRCGMRLGGADTSQADNFTASDLSGAAIFPALQRFIFVGQSGQRAAVM